MGCGLEIILLLVLYIIWDVNYFIRCVFTVGLGRLLQKKRKITDTTTIHGKRTEKQLKIMLNYAFLTHKYVSKYIRVVFERV